MKKVIIGIIVLLVVAGSSIAYYFTSTSQDADPTIYGVVNHETKQMTHDTKGFRTEATIGGIGDILIHDWVFNDAYLGDDTYDFKPMFDPIRSTLQQPDFLIANQESTPGGADIGIYSYPSFNSPYEIVDALIDSGVDMVTTANNHSLDRGEKQLLSAIEYYEKVNLPYTGTFKSPEDKADIRVMHVNGISIAILSYATHFNGIPVPKGKDYLVNVLDSQQVLTDIEKIRPDVDFVLLALHWGDEYVRYPNSTQTELANLFIQAGADIIFGHHPHVLQPVDWIERPDGTKGLVVYSLGNFLSGQYGDFKDIGAMVEVTITKQIDGDVTSNVIQDVAVYPTFTTSQNKQNYRIYPLAEAHSKGLTKHSHEEIESFFLQQ